MSELQTITFDEFSDRLMPILHELLVLRLAYNRTFNNVSIETEPRFMDICWQDPKDGKDYTQTKQVKPFNANTLCMELAVQFEKLQKDHKEAQERQSK